MKTTLIYCICTLYCLCVLLTSCDSIGKNKLKDEKYFKLLEKYDGLIEHFPKRLPVTYISEPNSKHGNIGLKSIYEFGKMESDSIMSELNHTSLSIYDAKDSCLLVVNRFSRNTEYGYRNQFKSEMKRPDYCTSDYYPVPNFWHDDDSKNADTSCRLSTEYKLYVLEANSGFYNNDLHENSGRWMPDEWRHGYSRGVAVNLKSNIFIFWIIIW